VQQAAASRLQMIIVDTVKQSKRDSHVSCYFPTHCEKLDDVNPESTLSDQLDGEADPEKLASGLRIWK